ncbi:MULTISPECIES: helix-turn-helix domain-containing protein [unclassified Caballeronia]|uniref:helix-turn-helix domain-containing protein n=1 Tax=unclassified Caballeronia TaxID=2646786 RepID=UPI00285DE9C3|nr:MULTISPECIES: helix-turn-helix domain-containing protein [unclassified Caballeronia]MDR5740378.1 helix-turn-helix domain-containing protein [Caballeronia sp. LZ016]MDR5808444.1 helix-turn-helix domain-containing protein [Caballeronia sp. LZ019]
MDSLITAAARALAAGDPLGALNRVAWRNDAPALALRGIAMAQLGDFARAKVLIKSAARAFGAKEAVARARCIVAEAEIALASRELAWPAKALDHARAMLEAHGDHLNATHARTLEVRRALLIGRIDEAERMLGAIDSAALPAALLASHELMAAGIAMRRVEAKAARRALARAREAACAAGIPALVAEIESARHSLDAPAARIVAHGETRLLSLDDVETLFASDTLIVDACRNIVRDAHALVSLTRRPVLFVLARMLAQAWPSDTPREALIARAFRIGRADETHRVRLRVEMGRLRAMLRPVAELRATRDGYALTPRHARAVAMLARPVDDDHASLLACLADGQSWSSSALALALNASQRTVQRALEGLASAGKVQSFGRGRARRWMTPPMPGFTTALLLPADLTSG